MKRFLATILAVIMITSVMPLYPITAQSGTELSVYKESYGRQLGENDSNLSRYIYNQMVQEYVYKDGDLQNQDGKYTGMAKPLSKDGEIVLGSNLVVTKSFKNMAEYKAYDWSKSGEYILIDNSVRDAMDAFIKDYPQVYWLDKLVWKGSLTVELAEQEHEVKAEVTIHITLRPEECEKGISKYINSFNEAVYRAKDNIISSKNIKADTPKQDIVKYIHDFIASKVDYNFDAVNNPNKDYNYAHTAVPVFLNGMNWNNKIVCDGYSRAFKILCQQFNIQSAILSGYSINLKGEFESHAWNAVEIMGKWYAVDIAWDDQADKVYSTYLLAGNMSKGFYDIYQKDHIPNGHFSDGKNAKEFVMPQIAEKGFWQKEESTNNATEVPTTGTNKKPNDNNVIYNKVTYHWIVSGLVKNKTYTGKQMKQKIKVTCDGKTLKEGKDYKISYKNNVNVGTAKIILTPIGIYKNAKAPAMTYTYKIVKASIKKVSAKKIKAQKYKKGRAIKPKVQLKYNGRKLKKSKDYTISYKKNKKKGTAQIIIKGKGNFKGTKKIKFKIK